MFLDISHRSPDWVRGRFPGIYEHCMRHGFDMTRQPLPVVPAAHYFCGGVTTDLTGRTTLPGLFAAGNDHFSFSFLFLFLFLVFSSLLSRTMCVCGQPHLLPYTFPAR